MRVWEAWGGGGAGGGNKNTEQRCRVPLFQEKWRDPERYWEQPGEGEVRMAGKEESSPHLFLTPVGWPAGVRGQRPSLSGTEQGACLGAEATQPGPGLLATGQCLTAWAPNLQPHPLALASSARQNKLVRASCCATQPWVSRAERAPTLAHRWEALATRTEDRPAWAGIQREPRSGSRLRERMAPAGPVSSPSGVLSLLASQIPPTSRGRDPWSQKQPFPKFLPPGT